MAAPFVSMLGETLLNGDAQVKTSDALAGKTVAFYFSAHWCPPCKRFTPKLAECYAALKKEGKPFEVVFISSDRDAAQHSEYYGSMPWLALPFADRDTKNKLGGKFGVSGIPKLVIMDENAKIITKDGVQSVFTDGAAGFPWTPPTVAEMLGDELVAPKGGASVKTSSVMTKGKTVGLYFSAHWCPPCRGFTPELAKRYTALKEAGKDLEIIFVSSDKNDASFKEYHAEMPWLALPFARRQEKAQLSQAFGVEGIPMLVFIDGETGAVINDSGRGAISADSYIEDFPYLPKPVNDVDAVQKGLNEETCLMVMQETASVKAKESVNKVLLAFAEQELAKPEDAQVATKFFTANGGQIAAQIRKQCRSTGPAGDKPQMVLLSLGPGQGAYYVSDKEVNAENLAAFLKGFSDGSLDRKQFGQN